MAYGFTKYNHKPYIRVTQSFYFYITHNTYRSTDRDAYEDECEQESAVKRIDGELDPSETKEGFEDGLRSQSSNEISAHLTAKRKKSEKDC